MNTEKEILESFNQIKMSFEEFSQKWKNNPKLNKLIGKGFNLLTNQLMNKYNEFIQIPSNILIILKNNLDLKTWNLLTERFSIIIKHPIDQSRLGKNPQMIIQNIYTSLLEDLRNSYDFFKNVYNTVTNYNIPLDNNLLKNFPIFISNIMTFQGDLKKLKVILYKKFITFKDLINIEGDPEKDINDSIKFFQFALSNNPRNSRIFSNLGYIYREFLGDYMSSSYWLIRYFSYIDNENKKVSENLEKNFNSIRKKMQEIDYIVDNKIDNISFLKYDLEYLPTLFYRIIGILFMNIDIDELDQLYSNFEIIMSRILQNYNLVNNEFKNKYEYNQGVEKMIILTIFVFHYNLNQLKLYSKDCQKISNEKNPNKKILKFELYNHNLIKDLSDESNSLKANLKSTLKFLILFTKVIVTNIKKDNFIFIEKYLLILFYWLSINYDVFNLLFDAESQKYLKYLNFYLNNDNDIKKFFMPQTQVTLNILLKKINDYILPIELIFLGFIPMHRFFELNTKKGILKIDNNFKIENELLNKIILIHFLNSFNLSPQNYPEINNKFYSKINVTNINIQDHSIIDTNSIKEKLNPEKIVNINSVKKIKPLIILDASNIAMRHGNQKFSSKGIEIVINYFQNNGHKVVSFLPEYFFRQKDPNSYLNKKRVVPDNIDYLKELNDKHLVIQSPPQDYDDSYCIQYAKTHDAFIVTNDLFRDYLDNITDNRKRETERMWVKERCISFTFNQDEFIPNPDASFFKEFDVNEYNKINREINFKNS